MLITWPIITGWNEFVIWVCHLQSYLTKRLQVVTGECSLRFSILQLNLACITLQWNESITKYVFSFFQSCIPQHPLNWQAIPHCWIQQALAILKLVLNTSRTKQTLFSKCWWWLYDTIEAHLYSSNCKHSGWDGVKILGLQSHLLVTYLICIISPDLWKNLEYCPSMWITEMCIHEYKINA